MKTNYELKAANSLAAIRKVAATLPVRKRHLLLDTCDEIARLFKQDSDSRTAAQIQESVEAHHSATKRIVDALIKGRTLSFRDMAEFRTVEWHTRIHEAKTIVARNHPQYVFCSCWVTDDGHPYKKYWLELAAV